MADAFERFLASALAPEEGAPDRRFVAGVQARVAVDELLTAQRRALVGSLLRQIAALVSIALAIWWVTRAAAVTAWAASSPASGLAVLLIAFATIVALLSRAPALALR